MSERNEPAAGAAKPADGRDDQAKEPLPASAAAGIGDEHEDRAKDNVPVSEAARPADVREDRAEDHGPVADAAGPADVRDDRAKDSSPAAGAAGRDDQAKSRQPADDAASPTPPGANPASGPAVPGEGAGEKAAETPTAATHGDPLLDKATSATTDSASTTPSSPAPAASGASASAAPTGDEQLTEQTEPSSRKPVSDKPDSGRSDAGRPDAVKPDSVAPAPAPVAAGAVQDAEADEETPAEEIRRYDCSVPEQRTAGLADAASAIRQGKLVVIPTDTVYGIGADAFTPAAVNALLAAKGRGRDMPVPVLVGTVRAANALVDDLGPYGQDLIDAFWPGPLTIICHATRSLRWDLGDTKGTVAIRMPLHAVALELLKETGPMAVSSANRSGAPPATTAAEAEEQLGASVAVYLDGGRCTEAVPSTIVDLTTPVPRVLRKGAIPVEKLKGIVGYVATDE